MSQQSLLVIFGITGQQGSSVAQTVLNDPVLSQRYKIRGLTRDPSKPDAQALTSKGIEVVACDINNRDSLKVALRGAHTVFAMTVSIYEPGGIEKELEQGKVIADEVVAAGAEFLIYSAVPSAKKISGGKFPVDLFDVKDDVRGSIEGLSITSSFFLPGSFMSNFHSHMAPRPAQDEEGAFAVYGFVAPTTRYSLIDIAADTGKFVGAILADPEQYAGRSVAAATRTYSMTEMAEIMAQSSGKKISYVQIPKDVFAGFVPEGMRTSLLNMLSYFEEFGYYGPETESLVAEAARNTRGGPPTEFSSYLQREPLQL